MARLEDPERMRKRAREHHAKNKDYINSIRRANELKKLEAERAKGPEHFANYQESKHETYRAYRAANKERMDEQQQRYRDTNKEKIRIRDKKYRLANKEKIRTRVIKYREANRERIKIEQRDYYLRTKPERLLVYKRYRDTHRPQMRAHWAKRRATKKHATPPWFDSKKTTAVYQETSDLSELTGIAFQNDHIVPLMGKLVCGLHVHYNLQPLTGPDNASKSNKHDPWTYVHVMPS